MRTATGILALVVACSGATAQDLSPLKPHHVWLPMTGHTDVQMQAARAAGYDTILLKIAPGVDASGAIADWSPTDTRIRSAEKVGFKVIVAILGWGGLPRGQFWDMDESGTKIPDRLDPFWAEAMRQVEGYYAQIMDHFREDTTVVAFAPTWGIYGEAGFTSWSAGRSEHALARFNAWRKERSLPAMERLPTRQPGPNTEFNRFIHCRYLYVEQVFSAMVTRLKARAAGRPVGMWQELYPVAGYLWNMVEVPPADFALYEAAFTYQTVHHPEKSLAETMGLRYRCSNADEYRQYYLPLAARKRGEGQRFMGCQLSNDYAVRQFGWTPEEAEAAGFDRWEDEFAPHLKRLMDAPLETPHRDVLLVFPTYAAAALTDHPAHTADVKLIDVLLRMFGCQIQRFASTRLDKITVEEMNGYRLIVVPASAFLLPETYARLKATRATVLFTGPFAQAFSSEQVPPGGTRDFDGVRLEYRTRAAGQVTVAREHPVLGDAHDLIARGNVRLPEDESFRFIEGDAVTVLRCGDEPLLSARAGGRLLFIHGQLFAGLCHDPQRKPPPERNASKDASAYEPDMWGPYSSTHPQNAVATALMRGILEHAGVAYRVLEPPPRTATRYLGDHMEQASVSANIAYNNMAESIELRVRLPYKVRGLACTKTATGFETRVTIPAFSYVLLEQEAGPQSAVGD